MGNGGSSGLGPLWKLQYSIVKKQFCRMYSVADADADVGATSCRRTKPVRPIRFGAICAGPDPAPTRRASRRAG